MLSEVGTILLIFGVSGVVINRKNLIIMLMSIELVLLAASVLFIHVSVEIDDLMGEICGVLLLTVGAGESGICLAILARFFRKRATIAVGALNLLRG